MQSTHVPTGRLTDQGYKKGKMRRPAQPGRQKGPATPQPDAQPTEGPPGQTAVHESSAPSQKSGEPAKSVEPNASERAHFQPDERPQLKGGKQSKEQGEQAVSHPPMDMEKEQPEPMKEDPMQEGATQPVSDLDSPMEGQASAPPPKHPIGPEGGGRSSLPQRGEGYFYPGQPRSTH